MFVQNIENRQLEANANATQAVKKLADSFVSAFYTPSKMEAAIRTARSSDEQNSSVVKLAAKQGSRVFSVLKGADIIGADSLSIHDIASMHHESGDGPKFMPIAATEMGRFLVAIQNAKIYHPELDVLDVANALEDNPSINIKSKSDLVNAIDRNRNLVEEPSPDRPKPRLTPN